MAWTWTKEVATVAVLFGGSLAATSLDLAFATADPNERLKTLVAAITTERTVVPPVPPRAAQFSRTADEKSASTQPLRGPASQEVMNGGGTSSVRMGAGVAIRCGDFFVLSDAVELHSIHEQWAPDCHFEDWKWFHAEQRSAEKEPPRRSPAYQSDSERSSTSTAAAPFAVVTKFLTKPKGLSADHAADRP